jgi:hypothetical protein
MPGPMRELKAESFPGAWISRKADINPGEKIFRKENRSVLLNKAAASHFYLLHDLWDCIRYMRWRVSKCCCVARRRLFLNP